MQSAKEAASNVAASAKAGLEKTKAVVGEKAEKMTTRDPVQKQVAEEKKEAKIHEAERMKHETRAQTEAAKRAHGHGLMDSATDYATGTRTTTGAGDPAYGTDVGAQHTTGTGTGLTGTGTGLTGTGTGLTGARRDPRT